MVTKTNEMITKTFTAETTIMISREINDSILNNDIVVVNITTFYDRIRGKETAVISYYE